jgi:hypothetical protein
MVWTIKSSSSEAATQLGSLGLVRMGGGGGAGGLLRPIGLTAGLSCIRGYAFVTGTDAQEHYIGWLRLCLC